MHAVVIIGLMLAIFGLIIAVVQQKNLARRRRIIDTPTSKIRDARGGPVEIKGRILPAEAGVFLAPFSGRHAVWGRVQVEEYRSSGKSGRWVTVVNEVTAFPFFIEDDSGERARVHPQGALVLLDKQQVARSGTFNDAHPALEAFLAQRGISSTGWLGFNKSMRYEESLLVAGDAIYALGPSQRQGAQQGAYRDGAGELWMGAGPNASAELILTNKTEEELIANLRRPFVIGVVMLAAGGLMMAGGFLVYLR